MTEKRPFGFRLWLLAALIVFASCNPYEGLYPSQTATAEATRTAGTVPVALPEAATPTPVICTVSTGMERGALNLRTGPGTSYAVIRVLSEGEILTVIERGDWLKVQTRHSTGFIHSHYCEIGD